MAGAVTLPARHLCPTRRGRTGPFMVVNGIRTSRGQVGSSGRFQNARPHTRVAAALQHWTKSQNRTSQLGPGETQ